MKAIKTSSGVAWVRATGNLYPKEKRLFEDPFSEKLCSPLYKFFLFLQRLPRINEAIVNSKEKSSPGAMGWLFCRFRYIDDVLKNSIAKKAPGAMGWLFCRFRYIDDVLKNSIAKKEIETVVNLGAGMDCRAYFIPGIENLRYFEVDHPSVIKKKIAKMKKILGKLPDHVTYVPIDFETQSLDAELKKAGYNLTSKTLFIWEGVTQYISKEANDSTLKCVAQSAPGSKIVFTYILKSFIEGKNIHEGIKTW